MADDRAVSEIVTNFFLITCRPTSQLYDQLDDYSDNALRFCAKVFTSHLADDDLSYCIPLITGSVAEFYIRPIFSCIGDMDIMLHANHALAIPAGTVPPTQLPGEFHNRVTVDEIIDSVFPGYVYLVKSYLLTECNDDGEYKAVQCRRGYASRGHETHKNGPAFVPQLAISNGYLPMTDIVFCVRCLSWPSQAADWPSRHSCLLYTSDAADE